MMEPKEETPAPVKLRAWIIRGKSGEGALGARLVAVATDTGVRSAFWVGGMECDGDELAAAIVRAINGGELWEADSRYEPRKVTGAPR